MLEDGAPGPESPPRDEAPEPVVTLEFQLHLDDVTALARLPAIARAAPSRPFRLIWYDHDDAHSLAAQSLCLQREGISWQVDRLAPDGQHDWPACAPAPTLSRAGDPAELSPSIPFDVVPVSAFEGRSRAYIAGGVAITVVHGGVRGVVETRPACRLTLTGSAAAVASLLPSLATLRLSVPRASLARHAIAAARGAALPARHLGAPSIAGDLSVSDGLTAIIGHLLDALLHWVDIVRDQRDPEAIHQARVATRRLRSAFSIYRSDAPCAELADAAAAVKDCAAALGAARDWDVFLAGTGARLAEVSGQDPRIVLLLRAASRRREAAYSELSAYLDGPLFRRLELSLGAVTALRPWETANAPGPEHPLHAPTAPFAVTVLTRRFKRVRSLGREIGTLPIETLHELRKDCKRLRYAAEFFAPAFPAKRTRQFLHRLSGLQEELGRLNDTAAAAGLMAQLGRAGRGYAGGMVDGMAAAAAMPARQGIVEQWKRFKRANPFWR